MCRTVTLRLRFDDLTRATRSHTVAEATADTAVLLASARGLLVEAMPTIEERGITLIGLTFTNLHDDSAIQLALPLTARGDRLDAALDGLHERFGSGSVARAATMGRASGMSVPLLPD